MLLSVLSLPIVGHCTEELTEKSYEKNKNTMGVVLVAVNWGRQWQCGKYENAQLERLRFERFPDNGEIKDEFSFLELKSPSRIFVDPIYRNLGFIVKPGQYAFTDFSVKVAKSVRDVGYINAKKEDLIKDNLPPEGGTFNISAGEVIYIGHFFLDCYYEPIPWRYYPNGRDNFNEYVTEFRKQYKYLADKEIIFRLFKTKHFGIEYELPNK